MHDPSTVAFEIKYPWKHYKNPKTDWERTYRDTFITIWHEDPCKDGSDDSCGWFIRSRHGDNKMLEKIISRYELDWDNTFTSDSSNHVYCTGLFKPTGEPHFSVLGITLNLFWLAAYEMMGYEKANKYVQDHLAKIMMFAENPTDSLFNEITRKFAIGCNEPYTEKFRNERIRSMASIIYAYILRDIRPWYKHPRWHIHHWKIQCHPWQLFKRSFKKCKVCNKRIGYTSNVVGSYNSDELEHGYHSVSSVKEN